MGGTWLSYKDEWGEGIMGIGSRGSGGGGFPCQRILFLNFFLSFFLSFFFFFPAF